MDVKGNVRTPGLAGTAASHRLPPHGRPADQGLDAAERVPKTLAFEMAAQRAADDAIKVDLRARVESLTQELRAAHAETIVARAELAEVYADLQAAHADRQASERQLQEQTRRHARLQATMDDVLRSHSWRLTAPLRDARHRLADGGVRLARGLRRALRRVAVATSISRFASASMLTLQRHPPESDADTDTDSHIDTDTDTDIDIDVDIDGDTEAGAGIDARPRSGTASLSVSMSGARRARTATAVAIASAKATPAQQRRRLALPAVDAPVVSIIIPVHGQLADTLHCLHAVARHWPRAAAEVIVFDDASPDGTAEALARVPGLRLLRAETNQGFIRACNLAAGAARGRYLLFLNNDTEVLRGWCDELLRTFDDVPRAGVVGAKLLYPDGRLQEAGGIIWQDGSGWNYGRGDDPDRPEYGYRREVDYVSGAALAMPRALFQRFGGFDERYLPAYGEDSDLAFKVREAGLTVIYQPLAQVIHREGGTSGTDVTRGVKAHQVENAERLFDRWRTRLAMRPRPGADLLRARERGIARRVLVIDHCTPEPDKDAGSITARNIMRLLQRTGCKVSFIPEDNFLFLDGYTTDLQRMGVECHYAPHTVSVEEHLQAQGALYDLVLIFRFTAARRHLETVRRCCPAAKVVVHTSDLHYLRETREAELRRDPELAARAERTRREELAVIRQADAVIVHSPVEEALLRAQCPETRVSLFGWAIDIPGTTVPFEARRDLVFLGGYQHAPNVDAVLFFVQEVMPLLRVRLPGVRFHAAGSHPPDSLRALAGPDVIVTGFVPDLGATLDRMRVAVAPLRYGAGIKGKVVTTMSHGLPGVNTRVAAEGLGLTPGEHTLIADSPQAMADAVMALYSSETLWTRMSRAGLDLVTRQFGFESGLPIVQTLLDSLALRPSPASASLMRQPAAPWTEIECVRLPDQAAYRRHIASSVRRITERATLEARLRPRGTAPFFVDGYCVACHAPARFRVGYEYSVTGPDGLPQPNWREHLVCGCGLNARTRMAIHVLTQLSGVAFDEPIYLMEQRGPLYGWLRRCSPGLIGSEFLGDAAPRGTLVDGVRHEDATRLSFGDASFAHILSFDVLEHVPDYRRAFEECARCLRPGGRLLFTVPFLVDSPHTVVRSRVGQDGQVEHLLPPEHHGDPMNVAGGILCFQHFGWDLLETLRASGFRSAEALFVWSRAFGYLGGEQVIFEAVK